MRKRYLSGTFTSFALMVCALVIESPHPAAADEATVPSTPKAEAAAVRFDPVAKSIEGWTVHVEPALLDGEHAEEGALALKMLANHLQRIAILVPEGRLKKLQQAEFWIEHAHPELGAIQYHPSAGWLEDHGYDKRLTKKIHVTHAAELFSRQQMTKHPAVILHELAHAYHDQVLGFDDARIVDAYRQAMDAGSYAEVLLYTGKVVRHYATTNHKEYFAEATEAYFYRNDFYPFVRAELQRHDSIMHDLLVEIWGSVD
jgi:dipeptidyl-peptidase-4